MHNAIRNAIDSAIHQTGNAWLIDIHDTGQVDMNVDPMQDQIRTTRFPTILASNRNNESCNPELFGILVEELRQEFDEVLVNDPQADGYAGKYFGGFVTQHYGEAPNKNLSDDARFRTHNAVQIEIDRSMLLNERTQQSIPQQVAVVRSSLLRAITAAAQRYW